MFMAEVLLRNRVIISHVKQNSAHSMKAEKKAVSQHHLNTIGGDFPICPCMCSCFTVFFFGSCLFLILLHIFAA